MVTVTPKKSKQGKGYPLHRIFFAAVFVLCVILSSNVISQALSGDMSSENMDYYHLLQAPFGDQHETCHSHGNAELQ